MNKRIIGRLFALALAACLTAALTVPALGSAAETDAVEIATVEDLQALAGLCALDTWSQGKTVILTADLNLAGADFTPIPTFGGTFLGQGHTVSGLRITAAGSAQGLFRYVQPSGLVRDLSVKGTVTPEGSRSAVGGLVGDNAGTLQNCAFEGTVRGESGVGGIAGYNRESGQITGCTAAGSVGGTSATGGIAGRNLGLLLQCENSAGVNLTETAAELPDMDAREILEEGAAGGERLLGGCSDTGGVAGYSAGVIQSCVNRGEVGYPHVGYNTGGIAGRQCGYLSGCVNAGAVHGRKDVGGIVGQAEPYVAMAPGRDTLERLRTELDTLDRLISRTLNDAQQTGDLVSAHLEAMGGLAADARDNSQALLDRVSGFADENIATVNTLAAELTDAMDRIRPALDDLSDVGGRLERLAGRLEQALDAMEEAASGGGQAAESLRAAVSRLRQCRKELQGAADALRLALESLYQAVFPEEGGGPVRPSEEALQAAREHLRQAFRTFQNAGDALEGALQDLQQALEQAGALPGQLGSTLEALQSATDEAGAIGRLLEQAFAAVSGAAEGLTRDGPTELTPLGDAFRRASDGLFDALSGLSGEMDGLRSAAESGGDTLNAGLRSVSRQFQAVLQIVLDTVEDIQTPGEADLIQDTSEEDIAATREGKVSLCRNTGTVEGDRNVGGVAGAVAIELDLDPEDDGADRFSFGRAYETKAVLQECSNYGGVTAKKDCVGGMAGRMDLGTALECQNYGPVSSTGGDYAGGVAGWADASVRSCYAKSTVAGGDYVGGIAGWAVRLQDCCAIATLTEGREYLGAIAGAVESGGVLRNNRFVDTGLAGVDGISYAGRAEPVPFEELSRLPGIPAELTAFTLTLLAEGETVAQIPFLYGEDLSRVSLPPVPEAEGRYGRWPQFDVSGVRSDITVEAVYAPWVTVTASPETSGRLSLALAEGRFTEEAVLHVKDSAQAPPSEAGAEASVWEISLSGTRLGERDSVPLRLLSPEGGTVWQYRAERWERVETARNGQYLLLEMEGTQGTFCVQPRRDTPWILPAAAAGAAAAVLLTVRKRRRKGRAVQSPEEKVPARNP